MFYLRVDSHRVEIEFDEFPAVAHDALLERIQEKTGELYGHIESAEPSRTGELRGETGEIVFEDNPDRIAGYVRVTREFGKAGALEYGSHRPINVNERAVRLRAQQGHIAIKAAFARASTAIGQAFIRHTNIEAHRYLRGPLEAMRGDIEDALREALEEAAGAA